MMSYTLLEFDEIDSTSNFLKENQAYFPHMTLIRTNHQTGGRGQFDRTWESKPHENLLFSILIKDIKLDQMYKVKSWIVTSLMHFFHQYGILVYFKEPNDLFVDDKKICGILIETQSSYDRFDYAVIGIGINLNQLTFANPRATSMAMITSQTYHPQQTFKDLLDILLKEYTKIV